MALPFRRTPVDKRRKNRGNRSPHQSTRTAIMAARSTRNTKASE